jgi:hypothetical protein
VPAGADGGRTAGRGRRRSIEGGGRPQLGLGAARRREPASARVGCCTAAGAGHGRSCALRGGGRSGEVRAGTGRGCGGGRGWACGVGGLCGRRQGVGE